MGAEQLGGPVRASASPRAAPRGARPRPTLGEDLEAILGPGTPAASLPRWRPALVVAGAGSLMLALIGSGIWLIGEQARPLPAVQTAAAPASAPAEKSGPARAAPAIAPDPPPVALQARPVGEPPVARAAPKPVAPRRPARRSQTAVAGDLAPAVLQTPPPAPLLARADADPMGEGQDRDEMRDKPAAPPQQQEVRRDVRLEAIDAVRALRSR